MPVRLYMDQHVPRAITVSLRLSGADVLTTQEDETSRFADSALLDRATRLGRVLFTQDADLLAVAAQRQEHGRAFGGVIYAHQLRMSVGDCIRDLLIIAEAGEPGDLVDRVLFLPL